MTAGIFLAIALAGGLGAALRMILDTLITTMITGRTGATFPWGTLVINVIGSFALGLIIGLVGEAPAPPWLFIVGAGLLGGFTTFSTASLETVRLLAGSRPMIGVIQGSTMLVLSCAAAALGLALSA